MKINKKDKRIRDLENLIANLPNHVYWVDVNNIVLGCNNRQAEAVGLSKDKIIGQKIDRFFGEKDAKFIRKINKEVIETGKEKVVEERYQLFNGQYKVFLSHKVPCKDDKENIIGILGISTDITKQKDREKNVSSPYYRVYTDVLL